MDVVPSTYLYTHIFKYIYIYIIYDIFGIQIIEDFLRNHQLGKFKT